MTKTTRSNTGARSKAARRACAFGEQCSNPHHWSGKAARERSTSANAVPPFGRIEGVRMGEAPLDSPEPCLGCPICKRLEGGTVAPTTPALTARGRGRTGSGDDTDSRTIFGKDRSWWFGD